MPSQSPPLLRLPPLAGLLALTLPAQPAAAVSVEGNMTHAGMAPVRAQATPAGNGRHVVDPLDLNMAGSWVITVTARTEGGRTLTTDLPLKVTP